jgi:hypothetical protein
MLEKISLRSKPKPKPNTKPKIDRTQIGMPTNFQHTGHIGAGEIADGFDVLQVQNSMRGKGGYHDNSMVCHIEHTPKGIDLTKLNAKRNNGVPCDMITSGAS